MGAELGDDNVYEFTKYPVHSETNLNLAIKIKI